MFNTQCLKSFYIWFVKAKVLLKLAKHIILNNICGLRVKNPYNSVIAHLNINSLRNKIVDVKERVFPRNISIFIIMKLELENREIKGWRYN